MKIAKDTVVSMDYELRLADEGVIDSSDDGSFVFLVGHDNIIPGLEKRLLGLEVGAQGTAEVEPEEGYGVRDESRKLTVPRSILPEDFHIEVSVPLELEDEKGETFPVWIAGVEGDQVLLDGNHPLAGQTLNFSFTVREVRAATAVEIAHGHVHGPGGHHHG